MKKLISAGGAILVFTASHIFASTASAAPESWYWGFQIGTGSANFSGSKQAEIDSLEADATYSGATLASQLFFYWPVGPQTLLGVSSGGAARTFTGDSAFDSNTFGQSILALSATHTFGAEYMRGLYVKGDIGYGTSYSTSGSNFFTISGSDQGIGIRAAVGYAFGVNEGTAILVNAEYGTIFGTDSKGYYVLSVGPLF